MIRTTLAVQAFQQSGLLSPGTYTLIDGVADQSLRLLQYVITSTAGNVIIQDSSGGFITRLSGDCSMNFTSSHLLSVNIGLEIVVLEETTIDACFIGFFQ